MENRIGNISFRLAETLGPNPKKYIDIVYWYPNPDYGQESSYIKEGEWYRPKYSDRKYKVHESCFKDPECCFTLATVDIEEEPGVLSVGFRPFNLSDETYKDYKQIVSQALNYAQNLYYEQINK